MIMRGGVCVVISFGCSSLFDLFLSAQSLFPGLWLSGVTIDAYKVPESAENGKVIAFFESVLFLFGWLGNSKHVKIFILLLNVFSLLENDFLSPQPILSLSEGPVGRRIFVFSCFLDRVSLALVSLTPVDNYFLQR